MLMLPLLKQSHSQSCPDSASSLSSLKKAPESRVVQTLSVQFVSHASGVRACDCVPACGVSLCLWCLWCLWCCGAWGPRHRCRGPRPRRRATSAGAEWPGDTGLLRAALFSCFSLFLFLFSVLSTLSCKNRESENNSENVLSLLFS